MRHIKHALSLTLALLFMLAVATALAEETENIRISRGFHYRILADGTAEITKYQSYETSLYLPDNLDGYVVTGIGDNAFGGCEDLQEIIIPLSVQQIGVNPFYACDRLLHIRVHPDSTALETIDGVLFSKADRRLVCYPAGRQDTAYSVPQGMQAIGVMAFNGCKNLQGITLPDSLTSIGGNAFGGCEDLQEIIIPLSVQQIGVNPFYACDRLVQIRVHPDSPVLESIDGVLFTKADRCLVCYPVGLQDAAYAVPQGTQAIGKGAFFGCINIQSIDLPNSLTSIKDDAFYNCESLQSIILPEGLTSIGDKAFAWCESLQSIVLPDSLISIGNEAFRRTSLQKIDIPLGVQQIGMNPFSGCRQLTQLSMHPNNQALKIINGVLFSKADKRLVWYPVGRKDMTYAVPQGTQVIGGGHFLDA
jgi:hypothetical protein